jgi:hypothetical protein
MANERSGAVLTPLAALARRRLVAGGRAVDSGRSPRRWRRGVGETVVTAQPTDISELDFEEFVRFFFAAPAARVR